MDDFTQTRIRNQQVLGSSPERRLRRVPLIGRRVGVHRGVHPASPWVPLGGLVEPASACQTSLVTLGTPLKMSVENMEPLW